MVTSAIDIGGTKVYNVDAIFKTYEKYVPNTIISVIQRERLENQSVRK